MDIYRGIEIIADGPPPMEEAAPAEVDLDTDRFAEMIRGGRRRFRSGAWQDRV